MCLGVGGRIASAQFTWFGHIWCVRVCVCVGVAFFFRYDIHLPHKCSRGLHWLLCANTKHYSIMCTTKWILDARQCHILSTYNRSHIYIYTDSSRKVLGPLFVYGRKMFAYQHNFRLISGRIPGYCLTVHKLKFNRISMQCVIK